MTELKVPAGTFHAGEQTIQAQLGIAEFMACRGKLVIRDHMPEQHRDFFAMLPFVIVGSIDSSSQPSASVLAGPSGFAHSPDPRHLHINALPDPEDALQPNLDIGSPLGILGIQPHTRRRNRVNGRIVEKDASGFMLEVTQSYGNCQKYIRPREAHYESRTHKGEMQEYAGLPARARDFIAQADTCFIASAHPDALSGSDVSQGVDVSHRGGEPGFINVPGGNTLILPDYAGNRFFNTLGNILLNPLTGLLFIDYTHGDIWQLHIQCHLVAADTSINTFIGAERLLCCEVVKTIHRTHALPLTWKAVLHASP